jgi:hypothetical protein
MASPVFVLRRVFGLWDQPSDWATWCGALETEAPEAVWCEPPGRFPKERSDKPTWCCTLEAFADALIGVHLIKGKKLVAKLKKRHGVA